MAQTIILKLGGSIITNKRRGRPVLRERLVKEIGRELTRCLRLKPTLRLILLHGGGSFGHPLAFRYRLNDRLLTRDSLTGFGLTVNAIRELGTQVARVCLNLGLPVIPLQTSSLARRRHGRLVFSNLTTFKTILTRQGIPLLGGDVIVTDEGRTSIASADEIAVALARQFPSANLLFATDVAGIFQVYPPGQGGQALVRANRRDIQSLINRSKLKAVRRDVTGGMAGKLRMLLKLRGRRAVIFDGTMPGAFRQALRGVSAGTTIQL